MEHETDENVHECIEEFSDFALTEYERPKQEWLSTKTRGSMDIDSIPPADIAEWFLDDSGLRSGEQHLLIRFWKEDFYKFNGRKWNLFSGKELLVIINKYLQQDDLRPLAGTNRVEEIVKNLKAIVFIPAIIEPPVMFPLYGEHESLGGYVLAKNGIVDIKTRFDACLDHQLTPYGPETFVLSTINANYDPEATCPIWDEFLARVQPDPAHRDLLQEIAGLLLVHDISFQRFFLFEGDGATGKTTFLNGIKALLGQDSFSAVPLEAFSASRTFPLFNMFGKLANIIEDMSEIDRAEEGMLKTIVDGGDITAERKYKDPVTFKPTARLVFATNVLPRFSDRTNALWRRLIYVPFRQVIPKEEQNRKFAGLDFWEKSGELSGILNWALVGLRRLVDRGNFKEPPECRSACEGYKGDGNPAAEYLETHVVEGPERRVSSTELYQGYYGWSTEEGHKPLGGTKFATEVKRRFPSVQKSKHAVWLLGGKRARMWEGISLVEKHIRLGFFNEQNPEQKNQNAPDIKEDKDN